MKRGLAYELEQHRRHRFERQADGQGNCHGGALGAVIIVIRFIVVFLGAISPYVWMFVTHPVMYLATAPVFMLLVSKTKKPGAFLIIDIIYGLLMMGATWMIPVCMAVGGILCELCLKKGGYGLGIWTFFGFLFFQLGLVSEFFPLWLTKDAYLAYVVQTMSQGYANVLGSIITTPALVLVLVLEVAGALAGYFFGKKMMSKHFKKAEL